MVSFDFAFCITLIICLPWPMSTPLPLPPQLLSPSRGRATAAPKPSSPPSHPRLARPPLGIGWRPYDPPPRHCCRAAIATGSRWGTFGGRCCCPHLCFLPCQGAVVEVHRPPGVVVPGGRVASAPWWPPQLARYELGR